MPEWVSKTDSLDEHESLLNARLPGDFKRQVQQWPMDDSLSTVREHGA